MEGLRDPEGARWHINVSDALSCTSHARDGMPHKHHEDTNEDILILSDNSLPLSSHRHTHANHESLREANPCPYLDCARYGKLLARLPRTLSVVD